MGMTVVEVVRRLEDLKHRRAVWMETVDHLSRFVDHEISRADHGIQAADCIISPVPQGTIKEFIEQINEQEIEPLDIQIEELEALGVYQESTEDVFEEEQQTKKQIRKRTATKSVQKTKAKPGNQPKGESTGNVRKLQKRTRGAIQGSR